VAEDAVRLHHCAVPLGRPTSDDTPAWQRAARAILDGRAVADDEPDAAGPGDRAPREIEPKRIGLATAIEQAGAAASPAPPEPAPLPAIPDGRHDPATGDPAPAPPARGVRAAVAIGVAVVVVLAIGWINRDASLDDLVDPAANRVTVPTDSDGRPADLPPSQPATPVSFAPSGAVVRPDPSRGRVVDPETGEDVVIPLLPGTVVDTTTGQVVVKPPTTTTGSSGTTDTTRPPTTRPPTTEPPTTAPPTTPTPTTVPPTTEPPTTEPPTTDTTTPPDTGGLGELIDDLLP
jgi:hypothetical protein